MSLIAGIDISSNAVDVCLLDEDSMDARWIRYRIDDGHKDLKAFDRACRLRDAMPPRTAWKDAGVIAIGIEHGASRNFNSVVAQSRVEGALLACLPTDIPKYMLMPASWKKLALGHGRASKQDGRVWADHSIHWQDDRGFYPQDAIDASCIAKATQLKHYAATSDALSAA
jgi:Holliday junction resolvasome RuvABC endonuclease subunit